MNIPIASAESETVFSIEVMKIHDESPMTKVAKGNPGPAKNIQFQANLIVDKESGSLVKIN